MNLWPHAIAIFCSGAWLPILDFYRGRFTLVLYGSPMLALATLLACMAILSLMLAALKRRRK